MNTDNRIFSPPPVAATTHAARPAGAAGAQDPREQFIPGTPDAPLGPGGQGPGPVGQVGAQPVKYPSGLQLFRDQSGVAFQASLPAGGLLPVPLFIESVNGNVLARAQNAPDQLLPAQHSQDGKVYVQLQPNAPLVVFDPSSLEFGLSSPVKTDPMYGTRLRDHMQLVGTDGTRRSIFNEAVGMMPGQHQFTEVIEGPNGNLSAFQFNGGNSQRMEVQSGPQGFMVGPRRSWWDRSQQAQMHLMPFSACAPGSLFAPLSQAVHPHQQQQPVQGPGNEPFGPSGQQAPPQGDPMQEVAAALNRGDLATVQRIMSQNQQPVQPQPQPQPQAQQAAPQPEAPPRVPTFADGRTPQEVGKAFAALEGGYTAQHVARVAEYASGMAMAVGLPEDRILRLQEAVDIMDVGKLDVPGEILDKTGKYTDAEFAEMKKHVDPARMASYFEMFGTSEDAAIVALTHHERPDGKGYPFGLTADKIPFESCLIAVADAFDSMTQKRWNRADRPDAPEAMSPEKALDIIKKNAGTQFHPAAVEALEHVLNVLKQQQQEEAAPASFSTGKTASEVGAAFAALEDGYTAAHSQRVTGHAVGIAAQLGLGEDSIKTLIQAGNVFDMGKLDVPAAVLDKTGKYTDEELAAMKAHVDPARMESYFKLFNVSPAAQEVVLAHHERPDGKGYPTGSKDAPMLARILAVADAFDSMTQKRWNRADRPDAPEAMAPEKALSILKQNAGTQFDARAVEAFEQVLKSRGG